MNGVQGSRDYTLDRPRKCRVSSVQNSVLKCPSLFRAEIRAEIGMGISGVEDEMKFFTLKFQLFSAVLRKGRGVPGADAPNPKLNPARGCLARCKRTENRDFTGACRRRST